MSAAIEVIAVTVPDIGDFHDVPVIEVHVQAGDSIAAEDALLSLESDKATLEVPSPAAGIVKEVKLKIGDKVSQGSLILLLEAEGKPAAAASAPTPAAVPPPAAAPVAASAPAPQAAAGEVSADFECQMLVLGAGPGGYSAAFRAADLGLKTLLVERYATLGGVCLNVGCIPSKALLHVASVMEEAAHFSELGVAFAAPQIDIAKLAAHKSAVVARLTGGLAAMAKMRKVEVIKGLGRFVDAHHLAVDTAAGVKTIRFEQAIIAAGSQPVKLPFVRATSSGVPSAMTKPPSSPPSGPRSMTQSADLMTSRLCSMTSNDPPPSMSLRKAARSFCTSSKWRPVVGSSRM